MASSIRTSGVSPLGPPTVDYACTTLSSVFFYLFVTRTHAPCSLECTAAALGLMTSEIFVMTPAQRSTIWGQWGGSENDHHGHHRRLRSGVPEC